MEDLNQLASLLRQRNDWEKQVTSIIGRPALIGHLGEFIAAKIFGIQLEVSASHKGSDGVFIDTPLRGKSVNIKWYSKHSGMLDINLNGLPNYYLVLAGDKGGQGTSKGLVQPWLIRNVFLFEADTLLKSLNSRCVKIGTATSVSSAHWADAEIYPVNNNPSYPLNVTQTRMLELFG